VHLIKECLNANPSNRPKAEEIKKTLSQWYRGSVDPNKFDVDEDSKNSEIRKQIKEAEIINKLPVSCATSASLGKSYETHSEAIYTSRLLNFSNLPKPKNSDDYYEESDNIISKESLGI
jgi:hypothetical protein